MLSIISRREQRDFEKACYGDFRAKEASFGFSEQHFPYRLALGLNPEDGFSNPSRKLYWEMNTLRDEPAVDSLAGTARASC